MKRTSLIIVCLITVWASLAQAKAPRTFVQVDTNNVLVQPTRTRVLEANKLATTDRAQTFSNTVALGASGTGIGTFVWGSGSLVAGACTVTNPALRTTSKTIVTWKGAGVGQALYTAASGTVAFASSATNDQTNAFQYITITP